jgi:propionate CoA-transferase
VLYLTERASFRLTPEGIELFEIAPGIDLQRDVLDQMDFAPLVAKELQTMDSAHFTA